MVDPFDGEEASRVLIKMSGGRCGVLGVDQLGSISYSHVIFNWAHDSYALGSHSLNR